MTKISEFPMGMWNVIGRQSLSVKAVVLSKTGNFSESKKKSEYVSDLRLSGTQVITSTHNRSTIIASALKELKRRVTQGHYKSQQICNIMMGHTVYFPRSQPYVALVIVRTLKCF